MAEERILVAKLGGRNCPVETNDNICLLGCSCESCNGGLSRQEAIEKIEKHLKASTIKFSTAPDVVAEIALNALLEG